MPDEPTTWQVYEAANRYLNEGLIRTVPPEVRPHGRRTRREWMSGFLPRLGHPQRSFGAVHVGGTSGKGSVAVMIAELLCEAGLRTGLHVTPYLQVSTEKLWVDGAYASADELAQLVEWIRPHAEAVRGPLVPIHGMAWVAITLEFFRRRAVDLGVVEVGIGGRSDLTTVLDTRLAVITSVGLDHLKTLGPTIKEIAAHKAGIIRPGCRAVVLDSPGLAAARKQAATVGAPLRVVSSSDYRAHVGQDNNTVVDFFGKRPIEGIALGVAGRFQAENAALALAAIEELDVELSDAGIRRALSRARLPGRMEWLAERVTGGCPVLLDGAHNPDKIAALVDSLDDVKVGHGVGMHCGPPPERRKVIDRRLHVVYGSLQSHCPDEALRRLAARATTFVATEPHVYQKRARPAAEVAEVVDSSVEQTLVEPTVDRAISKAFDRAGPDDLVLVTGSLYLVGEVRRRWYPDNEVLSCRTSW